MAALIKKDFMLLKKYVLFIIVIVFALPAALAAKSNEVNMVQSTMAFAFEVIYFEFLICRYLAMKEYQYPKTASFLCTLPYTRNMQVASKYLIYFIVFAFCCTAYWIDTLFVPNLIRLSSDLVIPVLFAVSVVYCQGKYNNDYGSFIKYNYSRNVDIGISGIGFICNGICKNI